MLKLIRQTLRNYKLLGEQLQMNVRENAGNFLANMNVIFKINAQMEKIAQLYVFDFLVN